MTRPLPFLPLLLALTLLAGCKSRQAEPDFARPLAPGQSGLRLISDPAQKPPLAEVFTPRDPQLLAALDRSIGWFYKPSSRRAYPHDGFTHDQAHASVIALRELLAGSSSGQAFERAVYEQFDVYQSVGWNGQGEVLFTGYYAPTFRASRTATGRYRHPLYRRPDDLVTDPATGQVLGRRAGEALIAYPTRYQIESSGMMRGRELVWLADPLEAYIVQVQGSARLILEDGSVMHIGYAGTNGREYVSIGQLLVRDRKLAESELSLSALRRYFQQHPQELAYYVNQNPRYVFFQEYGGADWPAGSLGLQVTPLRSLATDKSVFPRGGMVLVHTQVPTVTGGQRPFRQLMLDQDTGGAIRAAGRGDLFMGVGDGAEQLAGRQYARGTMYYLLLKPEHVAPWIQQAAGRQ